MNKIPYYRDNINEKTFLSIIKKGLKYRYNINMTDTEIKKYISDKKVTTNVEYCESNQLCIDEFITNYDKFYKK